MSSDLPGELPKPVINHANVDGNVFAVIGAVRQALNAAGQQRNAGVFIRDALKASSYDEVLRLTMEYVDWK